MLAKILPGVDVGEVNFDKGDFHGKQGVAQGDAGVGETSRVEEDKIDVFVGGGVDVVDEFGFGVGLEGQQFDAILFTQCAESGVDCVERYGTVVTGLAAAEQVQIGAV